MAEVLRQAWTIAAKDLKLEFRSPTAFLSSLAFTALVLAIFHFAWDPTAVAAIDLAPGALWITLSFAGLLALNRAFALERENRTLEGLLLSPLSRPALYVGKALSNLIFLGMVEAVAVPLFALFFNIPLLPVLAPLVLVVVLATIGFVGVGTLLSSIAVNTPFAELMLSLLTLPFLVPPIMTAAQITARLLGGRPFSEMSFLFKLIVSYDIVAVVAAFLIFEFTLDE